ncbi:MAG: hypothetical protein Q9166_002880 [cf. Caloplaca sp. 2 TL-2023]
MAPNTPLEGRLLRIPGRYVEQIHIIFQWLAFGNEPLIQNVSRSDQYPLTLKQLTATTVFSPTTLSVEVGRRISPAIMIQGLDRIIELEDTHTNRSLSTDKNTTRVDKNTTRVRFTNGVQEELLSENFSQGAAARFAINETQAKETIATTCLILLTDPLALDAVLDCPAAKVEENYPLAHFAALFWIDFIDPKYLSPSLSLLIHKLFFSHIQNFRKWTEILVQADNVYQNSKHSGLISAVSHYSDKKTGQHAPPIVWAAAFNLTFIVEDLLREGNRINSSGGGRGVSALYMAVHQKHYDIASLLLDRGGDVADGYVELTSKYEYGWALSPLYLVSHHKGYSREWIYLLLRDRSKLGRPGWRLEVAMESATRSGYPDCLRALVDAGADLNKGTGHEESYGCPLQAACDGGNGETVRFLLERGADPNTRGGNIWLGRVETPLQIAAYRGNTAVVNMLLQQGADPNIQGGNLGNALLASVFNAHGSPAGDGNVTLLRTLLEHGARPEEEWDMTSKLHELNFKNFEDKNRLLDERFSEQLATWINTETSDEGDLSAGSEAALRKRIDEKWKCIHEGQRQKKLNYLCGCMNEKRLTNPLHYITLVLLYLLPISITRQISSILWLTETSPPPSSILIPLQNLQKRSVKLPP